MLLVHVASATQSLLPVLGLDGHLTAVQYCQGNRQCLQTQSSVLHRSPKLHTIRKRELFHFWFFHCYSQKRIESFSFIQFLVRVLMNFQLRKCFLYICSVNENHSTNFGKLANILGKGSSGNIAAQILNNLSVLCQVRNFQ